jgi:hypothetical protein
MTGWITLKARWWSGNHVGVSGALNLANVLSVVRCPVHNQYDVTGANGQKICVVQVEDIEPLMQIIAGDE